MELGKEERRANESEDRVWRDEKKKNRNERTEAEFTPPMSSQMHLVSGKEGGFNHNK